MSKEILNEMNEATSVCPGFRFFPSDAELVMFYLRNKVFGISHQFEVISEIDIYEQDPWELSAHSLLKKQDKVWFFFTTLENYGGGARLQRSTPSGYWKITGKERQVKHHDQVVGTKRILIFYNGRASLGIKTNWIMHEYRVSNPNLQNARTVRDAYVLCKIIDKTAHPNEVDGEDNVVESPETITTNDNAPNIDVEFETLMPSSERQAPTKSGLKRHAPSSSSFTETAANKRLTKSVDDSASHKKSTLTSADLEHNVPSNYVAYLTMLENQSRDLKTDVEELKAEAAEARSRVSALQSRVDELTMEQMGLKRLARG